MAAAGGDLRWRTDGRFFRSGGERVRLVAVTYGPFPGGWPEDFRPDFRRIAAAGFNALRLYEMPDRKLLDAALACGLGVFGGLRWAQSVDFMNRPGYFTAAKVRLAEALRETADHPALAGVYVANEIPPDLVRWMGPARVRRALEDLIETGRQAAPDLLFAYANFPGTEYLEPENADFSAFNIYLETPEAFRSYLKRLHHIAGDRPLVVSEFGLDSQRNGMARQAETLAWAAEISRDEETAGFTLFAWSDRWWTAGAEVGDWDFGLTDRAGNAKPALGALAALPDAPVPRGLRFSVIVCTRNGRDRIGKCLAAVRRMAGDYETIMVDDGSADGTADFVAREFPRVRLLRLEACGLSAARNAGAAAADGEILAFTDDDCAPDREWLVRLARVFAGGRFAAAGGPNLPPAPQNWREAVVCAAPGAPSHVMLDDDEAEHLPGCNLAVTREAFEAVGGFDPAFHTAGDDVDFCWRLQAAGYRLGFAPGAFVWHWRRPTLRAFLRQQAAYGRAERLLMAKYPEKLTRRGGAKWRGFIYAGGPVRVMDGSIIYHGAMGGAGYQMLAERMLPLRGLVRRFDCWRTRLALAAVNFLAPRLRAWERGRTIFPVIGKPPHAARPAPCYESIFAGPREDALRHFLDQGWQAAGPTDEWDLEKDGSRMLLATEYGERGERRTLLRLWDAGHRG